MKEVVSVILGKSPVTSIIGYAIAALTIAKEYLEAGETNWSVIGIGVLTALLGRKAADAA